MDTPSIILLGFSTAGKSYYLEQVEKECFNEFNFIDSDKYVSSSYKGHIYNIFMEMGREAAITFIENKEQEFLEFITDYNQKPQLIAAGPFLVIRKGWDKFIEKKRPFVIHLEKNFDKVYEGLLKRKEDQKLVLDTANQNFGSWDNDVTTQICNGVYIDIERDKALNNIQEHLSRITPIYSKYRNITFDSEALKYDKTKSNDLIDLIINKLRQNRS